MPNPACFPFFFEQLIGCVDAVLCCFLKAVSGQLGLEAAHFGGWVGGGALIALAEACEQT